MKKLEIKPVYVIVFIFCLLLAIAIPRNTKEGIFIDEKFFEETEDNLFQSGDDDVRMEKRDGSVFFDARLSGENRSAELVWSTDNAAFGNELPYAKVTFQNGTVIEGTWLDSGTLIGADGTPVNFRISVVINGKRNPISDGGLGEVFCELSLGMTETNGYIGLIMVGCLFYLLGAVMFLKPEETYFLFSK